MTVGFVSMDHPNGVHGQGLHAKFLHLLCDQVFLHHEVLTFHNISHMYIHTMKNQIQNGNGQMSNVKCHQTQVLKNPNYHLQRAQKQSQMSKIIRLRCSCLPKSSKTLKRSRSHDPYPWSNHFQPGPNMVRPWLNYSQ